MDDASDLLIFKMRGTQTKEVAQPAALAQEVKIAGYLGPAKKGQPGKSWGEVAVDPGSIYYKQGGDYPDPMHFYREAAVPGGAETESEQAMKIPMSKAESRERAKGLFCSAHPFRHAYAICAYCHRPFCYEDTVEYQKEYYCTEDIDKISTRYTEQLTGEYSTSSILTTFVLIGGFLLYFYYSYPQLTYLFQYMFYNPSGFIGAFSLTYGITLITLAIMVASVIGGMYILLGSRRGQIIAMVVSMAAVLVLVFTYLYISSGTLYLAILAGFEFVGFLAAVNSSASEAMAYNQVFERGPEYGLAYGYGAKF